MAEVFGQFTYTGITGVLSASCTFTQGIAPSVISVSVPYDPYLASTIQRTGTVRWIYANSVVRELPDCAIDSIDLNTSGGANVWDITILDRRWMWRGGYITGSYNEPVDGENADFEVKRKKDPRELATLCLEAMGEENFDVSALPTSDYPQVEWEVSNPSECLADICDLYSCIVNMRRDNTVNIVKIGQGMSLPSTTPANTRLYKHAVFDPAELPSKLIAVSAPVEYEIDMPLMMVMIEEDGSVVPLEESLLLEGIEDPADEGQPLTWESLGDDWELIEDLDKRDLAKAYGKLWQVNIEKLKDKPEGYETEGKCVLGVDSSGDDIIAEGVDTATECKNYDWIGQEWKPDNEVEAGNNPNFPNSIYIIEELDQILPLNARQMATIGKFAEKTPKEAVVYGQFFDGSPIGLLRSEMDDVRVMQDDPQLFSEKEKSLIYRGGFSIDEELGLVRFSEAVTNWKNSPGERKEGGEPAVLILRCCVSVRDKDSREAMRYRQELEIDPTSKMPPVYEVRDDAVFRYWRSAESNLEINEEEDEELPEGIIVKGWLDNSKKVNNALRFYLSQRKAEYEARQGMSASYTGFIPTETDGKIRQISFSIAGSGAATSGAEWNRENEDVSLTYKEMRQRQVINEMQKMDKIKKRNKNTSSKRLNEMEKRVTQIRSDEIV